jgi:[acyl-carrier-protein] S-malonyltransferase
VRKIGYLFPGQGAQYVGMGFDLYQKRKEARAVFDQADELLGFYLSKLCFEGPETELTRTVNAQAAIFVTSLATLSVIRSDYSHLRPALACGLSLGEFTALTSLNSLSFQDGLKLVRSRGELMEKANQKNPGTMASIIGLSLNECEALCQETGAELANINSYDQTVISGSVDVVSQACHAAQKKGAKKAIVLKVGGAFHSSLMASAQAGLENVLRQIKIREPEGVFVPNVSGTPVSVPETIRTFLAEQLAKPVQWVRTVETIAQIGLIDLIEIGPGRVLKGLVKRVNPRLNVMSIEKESELEQLKPVISNTS